MPLQDIRFNQNLNNWGVKSHNQRITESEYLNAIQIIKDYKNQINDDLKNLENYDSEKERIRIALIENNSNRVATANQLRMSDRTLYRKIKKYGLDNDTLYPDVE